MLTDSTKDCFLSLCDAVQSRASTKYEEATLAVAAEMNARGVLRSSIHIQELSNRAAVILEEAAGSMFEALREANNAEPAVRDPAARIAQLQRLFDDRLVALGLRLTAELDNRTKLLMGVLSPQLRPQAVPTYLERARREFQAKIQITISSMAATRHEGLIMQNTFNGPVGAFQTGVHSTATVTQVAINPPNIEVISAALDALVEALQSAPTVNDEQRAELTEVVHDVRTEAGKDKPNKSKLGGLLSSIGSVIQTIPAAAPAWAQVVQWCQALGVAAKGMMGS